MQADAEFGMEITRDRDALVKDMSNGRFIIESYSDGGIVGAKEIFDTLNNGTIDAGIFTLHTFIGQVPSAPLFSARPLGMVAAPMMIWMDEFGGQEYMMEALEPFNFGYASSTYVSTPEDLCWSNVPMDTIESWKGVKFRTKGFWAEVLQDPRVGASVVTLAGSEVYNALERGILDATELSTPVTDMRLGFHEIAKYLMVPGIHQPSTNTIEVVYDETWAALPDDLKAIYISAMNATQKSAFSKNILLDVEALEFFQQRADQGLLEIVVAPKELQEHFFMVADDLYESYREDPFFDKVYQSQIDFMAKYKLHVDYQIPEF
jgi:TRAP-type mannitol/chloroaromatic compound transport system substrate-binding protein